MKRLLLFMGAILGLAALCGPAYVQEPDDKYDFPIQGKSGEGMEPFDGLMINLMKRHGIPGGALAIAKDGKLIFAKGYGWSDIDDETLTGPDTMFLLASLSKPITAAAILKLIEDGKLNLDDFALDLIPHIRPKPGAKVDPRMRKITVRHLLTHAGGWNRNKSGDPSTWTAQMAKKFGLPIPPTQNDLIAFMLGYPLDFDPGSDSQYSNIGYIMLGVIIEKVTGQTYEAYVKKHVLEPMGIKKAHIQQGKYRPGEAHRYLEGIHNELPPLQSSMMVQAAAGWSMSPIDLVRFLTATDGSRGKKFLKDKTFDAMLDGPFPPVKAQPDGTFAGLGWAITFKKDKDVFGYFQDGHWHGARAFMKRSPNGINWAMAFNTTMQPDKADALAIQNTRHEVHSRIEQLKRVPDLDLFKEFP